MTPDQLQSARLLCEQAPEEIDIVHDIQCVYASNASEVFYGEARTLIPALLDEVERLRAWIARTDVAFDWIDYWGGNEQSRADADMIACGNYTVDAERNLIDHNGKRVPR